MKEEFLMKQNIKKRSSTKRNITLLAAALLLTVLSLTAQSTALAQAPTPLWYRIYGGLDTDRFYSFVEVSTGGFALAGYSDSSYDGEDVWFVRTDTNGVMLWSRSYDFDGNEDRGETIVEVSSGGFAILGNAWNATNMNDAWLIRTDTDGAHLWNRTYGTTDWDNAESLIEVSGGGFAFAGMTLSYDVLGGGDIWLVRLDANGNILWNKTYDTPTHDYGYELVEVSTGGFAIAGAYNASWPYWSDVWLLRTDANGNHLWNKTFNPGIVNSEEEASTLVEVSTGGFALAGYTNASGYDNVWIIRTDASGNSLWSKSFGGAYDCYCYDIIEYEGGFALSGGTWVSGSSRSDLLLARFDSEGDLIWSTTWGGSHTDRGYSLLMTSLYELVVCGYTRSYSSGDSDALLLRFASEIPIMPFGDILPWIPVIIIIVIAVIVLILIIWYLRKRK
jgi:hypothetical protein